MSNSPSESLHPVEVLFQRLSEVEPYPKKLRVVAIPERIRGTAFFPGGAGLWRPDPDTPLPEMPIGGVMILGQDFHSKRGYEASLAAGHERLSSPTWRQLLPLLDRAGIRPERCFFTNAYMGLREGDKSTGPFPGARDTKFAQRCREFLGVQISVQKPRLILTLGSRAPAVLAELSPELSAWRGASNLAAIDASECPVVFGARFDNIPHVTSVVVAFTHPSQRRLNVGRRRYRGRESDDAEALMLSEAVQASGIRQHNIGDAHFWAGARPAAS